jgi:hypothetical protein
MRHEMVRKVFELENLVSEKKKLSGVLETVDAFNLNDAKSAFSDFHSSATE